MFITLLITTLTALRLFAFDNLDTEGFIIGGTKAPDYPFFLSLSTTDRLEDAGCGASLIADGIAITAAHCVDRAQKLYLIHNHDSYISPLVSLVYALRSHKLDDELNNDIALLFFDQSLQSNKMAPIALNKITMHHQNLIAIGRGVKTSIGTILLDEVHHVELDYIENTICQDLLSKEDISNGKLCAGNLMSGGKDSCQGDSGGPLIEKVGESLELVGVVSYGMGCGQKNSPGIYTRVSYFSDWIFNEIQEIQSKKPLNHPADIFYLKETFCYYDSDKEEPILSESDESIMVSTYVSNKKLVEDFKLSSSINFNDETPVCSFNYFGKGYSFYEKNSAKHFVASESEVWSANYEATELLASSMCSPKEDLSKMFSLIGKGMIGGDLAYLVAYNNETYVALNPKPQESLVRSNSILFCDDGKVAVSLNPASGGLSRLLGGLELSLNFQGSGRKIVYDLVPLNLLYPDGVDQGLSAKLVETRGKSELVIDNKTKQDLYSWKLSCNKAFRIDGSDESKLEAIFMYPQSELSYIASGDTLRLFIHFADKEKLSCRLNDTIRVELK